MANTQFVLGIIAALAFTGPVSIAVQPPAKGSHGLFKQSTDIGATEKGSTVYDATSGSYRITGGGADMWGKADAFRFSWVRLSGDEAITADVHLSSAEVPLAKAVLMFRQSLDPGSAYADIAIHGDGHITLQFRKTSGGVTADITAPEHGSVRLRIERRGDRLTAYAESADGKMNAFGSTAVPLQDPVYAGLGVCSHNATGLTSATFSNVRIEPLDRSDLGK